MNAISPVEYQRVSALVKRLVGIELGPSRTYLVESRLGPLLGAFNVRGYEELVECAESGGRVGVREAIIDSITTNETLWFRDFKPFEAIRDYVLPALLKSPGSAVRIWSAAASTGQEAYSLAMILFEAQQRLVELRTRGYEIVGTDVSAAAIKTARAGFYDAVAMSRGLTPGQRDQYFIVDGDGYRIKPALRQNVRFSEGNLLFGVDDGTFDVVFLRNVLIYFDEPTRQNILRRVTRALRREGLLFVGATESIDYESLGLEAVWFGRALAYRRTSE